MKVYCEECKWFDSWWDGNCRHSNAAKENWYSKIGISIDPRERNKDNHCKDFFGKPPEKKKSWFKKLLG